MTTSRAAYRTLEDSVAFTINQTGIERGATQLIFNDPPILVKRHEEAAPDAAYELSLTGTPVVVVYNLSQDKAFLRLKIRYLDAFDIAILETLWSNKTTVEVKLTAGVATTITCMFGPRRDQQIMPYNKDFATSKPDGTAVDPILSQYWAELFLLRME